jgi:hypothetical protein
MLNHNQEIFTVIDSTKIGTFKMCPRRYFYEYVLHWRAQEPNIHLEFGVAWHLAKEFLFLDGSYNQAAALKAYTLFEAHYRKFFGPQDDKNRAPKDPGTCMAALLNYCEQYRDINRNFEVLHTEVFGSFIIEPAPGLIFRICHKIDAVIMDKADNLIWVYDHKTASKLMSSWHMQWNLSTQMGTYINAVSSVYGKERVGGAKIDATFLYKSKPAEHIRTPVKREEDSMQKWLWTMLHYIQLLNWNHKQLETCSPEDNILMAFPENEKSCTMYGTCPYMDFCVAWANPLKRCQTPPIGMAEIIWDPRSESNNAKTIWES